MVLMALDHVRDYTTSAAFDPTDVSGPNASAAYFLTRWVTHFCAPVFMFLAGTGGFLAGSRGKSRGQLSWFLLTRGLWLAALEMTVVGLSWAFRVETHFAVGAVIWAIGWSMVVLSILVFLPTTAVAALGVAIIAFHNLFDNVEADSLGSFGWLWAILHTGQQIGLNFDGWLPTAWRWELLKPETASSFTGSFRFLEAYPLLPWIGTMAAGYGFGALFLLERPKRRPQLIGLGLVLTAIFIVLRASNRYGDPQPWKEQPSTLFTVFSFINCWKYPPSLLYLLMTLGPAITFLGLFDGVHARVLRPFIVFGRVPLFFYLIHLPLIHGLAIGIDYYRFGWSPAESKIFWEVDRSQVPEGYGLDLPLVYLAWIGVLVVLYPFCYGYMLLKRRYPGGILSYL
jgi:uncharacterized membrane protein